MLRVFVADDGEMSIAMRAPVRVTIDTSSREEAELVSQLLPVPAQAGSVRGVGFVRLRCAGRDVKAVIEAARAAVEGHGLAWLRVRVGDEDDAEHVFRGK
jgi:hypothetical protein